MKNLLVLAGLAVCLAGPPAATSEALMEPSEEALAQVRSFRARSMGVDRGGNLWAWSPGPAAVDVLSPAGTRLARYTVPGAQAVDADFEFGLAGLFRDGWSLQWFSRDGSPGGEVRLPGQATDIAWISPSLVALTPQTAPARIEVWDLQRRERVRTWGDQSPLQPGIGATRMRAVLLEYDWQRKLLYSLESFTGELQVWSTEGTGRLAWSSQIENPEKKKWQDWLAKVDQSAQANGTVQTPLIFSLFGALGTQGDFWVGRKADTGGGEVVLLKVRPSGTETKPNRDESCASVNFVLWGSWLISYRDPQRQPCVSVRRFS